MSFNGMSRDAAIRVWPQHAGEEDRPVLIAELERGDFSRWPSMDEAKALQIRAMLMLKEDLRLQGDLFERLSSTTDAAPKAPLVPKWVQSIADNSLEAVPSAEPVRVPPGAERLLQKLLPLDRREQTLGCLEEAFAGDLAAGRRARWEYWRRAVQLGLAYSLQMLGKRLGIVRPKDQRAS